MIQKPVASSGLANAKALQNMFMKAVSSNGDMLILTARDIIGNVQLVTSSTGLREWTGVGGLVVKVGRY